MTIAQRLRRKVRKLRNILGLDTEDWRIHGLRKVHFDIVDGCNLKCVGCPNSTMHKKVRRISNQDFDQCLRNIDVPHISLFRLFILGEPLLHNDVAGLLGNIKEQKFSVGTIEISTNAQHHDYKRLEEIFRTNRLDRLAVSCDGDGTPEEYERLRPPGKWPRMIEFLHKAKELRDSFSPNTQLITRTIAETQEARQRWTGVVEPLGWKPDFRDWIYMPGSSADMTGISSKPPAGVCAFLRDNRQLYIDYTGQVHPCCVSLEAGNLGNLLDVPFSRIVAGEERRRFVKELKSSRAHMSVCGSCFQ